MFLVTSVCNQHFHTHKSHIGHTITILAQPLLCLSLCKYNHFFPFSNLHSHLFYCTKIHDDSYQEFGVTDLWKMRVLDRNEIFLTRIFAYLKMK